MGRHGGDEAAPADCRPARQGAAMTAGGSGRVMTAWVVTVSVSRGQPRPPVAAAGRGVALCRAGGGVLVGALLVWRSAADSCGVAR